MARTPHHHWIAAMALVLAVGCKDQPAPPPSPVPDTGGGAVTPDPAPKRPNIVRDEGPEPTPETPVATAGDFVVTLADFDEASRISLLFAPAGQTSLSPEQLAIPHVHLTMSRSLLAQTVIAAELERRELSPTKEQLDAWLRTNPKLSRFAAHLDDPAALEGALAPLNLTPDHLYKVARAEVSNRMLATALAEEIGNDEIWTAFKFEGTTRTAAIVASSNVPSSKEIDEWMGDHADEIDEQFRKNPSRYRSPRRVRLNIVKPTPGEKISDDLLKKASELLLKGVQPATVAKELGLVHELDSQLVRGENTKAFRQTPGQGGWASDGPRGAYAWKVVGFEASKLPEMTRPLRREIAAELQRTTSLSPSVAKKLATASKTLAAAKFMAGDEAATDAAEKEIEAIDGLSFQITTFPNNPSGPLPNHGLAEEVITTTFATSRGKTSAPFLSRERAFVVRVLASQKPSRKDFDKNIAEYRKTFLAAVRPRIVARWGERKLQEIGVKVDVKPLRIKYGVLQKE